MKPPFFLTEVAEDWTDKNLSAAQEVLFEANDATLARSNIVEDPLLNTPNLPNYRGVLRWILVQKIFELAVQNGKFDGITAEWVDLGGVSVLELRGKYTRVTPCHLLTKDESPRESTYRRSTRIENQVYQTLFGFEPPEPGNELLNLLLVHGGRFETFSYLRAYTDRQDRGIFLPLSNNIMLMPSLLKSIDFEPIDDPQIGLNDADEEENTGENAQ
jgi:hypothetical protein